MLSFFSSGHQDLQWGSYLLLLLLLFWLLMLMFFIFPHLWLLFLFYFIFFLFWSISQTKIKATFIFSCLFFVDTYSLFFRLNVLLVLHHSFSFFFSDFLVFLSVIRVSVFFFFSITTLSSLSSALACLCLFILRCVYANLLFFVISSREREFNIDGFVFSLWANVKQIIVYLLKISCSINEILALMEWST